MYYGGHRKVGLNFLTLKETSPLELTKLNSMLGVFSRIFGVDIAERIVSFKIGR